MLLQINSASCSHFYEARGNVERSYQTFAHEIIYYSTKLACASFPGLPVNRSHALSVPWRLIPFLSSNWVSRETCRVASGTSNPLL